MSAGDNAIHARNGPDRRVAKTRALLLASFDRLLLARGYDEVSVRAVTADADVGRSTFYEHFEGKQDLLEHSVAHVINVLAATTAAAAPSDALRDVLTHVNAQRSLSSELLRGSAVRSSSAYLPASLKGISRSSPGVPSRRRSLRSRSSPCR